eukprot:457886-Pyramimonas_sp.AAC.1
MADERSSSVEVEYGPANASILGAIRRACARRRGGGRPCCRQVATRSGVATKSATKRHGSYARWLTMIFVLT